MRLLCCFVLLVCLACSSLDAKLVGKYRCRARFEAPMVEEASIVPFVEAIGSALMSGTLELRDDRTFRMTMLGFPTGGNWETRGEEVVLIPMDPKFSAIKLQIAPEVKALKAKDEEGGEFVFEPVRD